MPVKVLNQKSFFKGLNASVADTSQPKGALARISNLQYFIRGSLRVIDGNLGFATLNGAGPTTGQGLFMDVVLYQFSNATKYYLALQKDPSTQLATPTGLTATDGGAGGTLAAATYYYKVTALDGAGGQTLGSTEASVTVAVNHKINLAWTAVTNAAGGYNVYRSTTPGAEVLMAGAGLPACTIESCYFVVIGGSSEGAACTAVGGGEAGRGGKLCGGVFLERQVVFDGVRELVQHHVHEQSLAGGGTGAVQSCEP